MTECYHCKTDNIISDEYGNLYCYDCGGDDLE
jgi:transcription initiation factor TFIIIB Brf1 subunit/transcription initiation factor TFIIB